MVVEPLKRQFGHSFPKTFIVIGILVFSTLFTFIINKDAISYINVEETEVTTANIDSFTSNIYKAIIKNVTINPAGVVCKEDSCITTLVEFGNKIVLPIQKNDITASPTTFSGSLYILDNDQINKLSSQFDAQAKIDKNVLGENLSNIVLEEAKLEETKIDSNTKIFQHSISMSSRGVYGQTLALGLLSAAFLFIILNKFFF